MFIEIFVKIVHPFQGFLFNFVIIKNNKTICWMENGKMRIA